MTTAPLFQIDAFTDTAFAGNPAAVVPLEAFPDDGTLQAIAAENNLAETAFLVPVAGRQDAHSLRWFTPAVEVPLCGHATLAAAHALWTERAHEGDAVTFETRSGTLAVRRDDGTGTGAASYEMDFPADPPRAISMIPGLPGALGADPDMLLAGQYIVAVFPDRAAVEALSPDFRALGRLVVPSRDRGAAEACVIATAPGQGNTDFVSRFFGPSVGIDEDPVTGSAHCTLAPYWAERLGKKELSARQLSSRGGDIRCTLRGDRVLLRGACVTYLRGEITFPAPDPA